LRRWEGVEFVKERKYGDDSEKLHTLEVRGNTDEVMDSSASRLVET
jgi:hypothetical protein